MTCVGIIPARGGSKGVPGKNIRPVAGKPLILWTLEVALAATELDRVIVSTDSPEIARISKQAGAEVPFMRPPELARDDTPGIDPLLHAVQWLADYEAYEPEKVMLLQPTSPLRSAEDIAGALRLFEEKSADSVVSVTEPGHHPYWMKRLDETGRMKDFITLDRKPTRRQDLSPVWALDGAIYLIWRQVLMSERTLFPANTFPLFMPRERSIDINTEWDLRLAELCLQGYL